MWLSMFFRFCCSVSRLLSRELSGAYVLTTFLYSFTSVVNAQQLASVIEPLPAPMSGEYRSVKDGVWNDAATWQEWTGTEWTHASTLPSEAFLITPVVKGWNISTKMGGGDIHTINLPADIETGDLLLIFWTGAQTGGRNVSIPSGFTRLYFADGGNRRRTAWYKVASGAEGQTIDVIAGTGVSAHTSYRIAAGTYSSVPVVGVVATGHSSSPDPPVLSTGIGLVPTLWIATSHSDGNGSASSPSGYPPLITAYTGSVGNNGARTATTHLVTTNATSQNPGAFSLDQNSSWAANTIALQGAFRKAVVKNEHTVTVTNSVNVSDVDVYGTLDVNTNTAMTIAGKSTLTVHEGGRLRLPGNNIAGNDARMAGAGNFILSEGGYLEIGSLNGITSSGTTASYGNIRVSGTRSFHAGAHYIYNRNGLVNNNQSTGTGYPTNLTGSLTIDNPGTVTRTTSSSRNISTGILYLVKGTFAAGGAGFTMGNNTSSPNGTIVRTGGILIGGVGNNWHQVIYKGDSKTTGPELLGNGLRNINVDLLDKSQVLTLNTNITIPGSLTLVMGLMKTNSNTLTVSNYAPQAISGGSSDSFVQGNLVRGIASGTNTYNFPLGSDGIYAPVSLAFTTNSINRNVTGSTIGSNHKNIASSGLADPKLERHWTFSATGGGSYNYNPTFSWDSADEEDGFEFNNALVARYDGSTWTYPTMSDKTVNSAKATGLNGFGDFQLGSEDMTPDASKSSIKANRSSDVVANNMDASIVTVTVRNSNGNPVGAGVDVFLRVTGGSVGDGGLNPSDSWKTNVNGQVEVNLTSTVANNVVVTGYLGMDDEGEWIGGDKIIATVEVNFKAGAAKSLSIITQPVGQASGSTMAAQPLIHILDANDNVVTDDSNSEVTVAITSGDGGTLSGILSIIANGGVAKFSSLTLAGKVGETYELTFFSDGLEEAVSEGVRLSSHGSAAQIALSGLISNLPSGDIRQLTATLKDGAGNLIDTGEESSLEITFSQNTELGSVSGLKTITAERGVALITIIGKNGGQVTVIASTESPTLADQLTFTITVDNTILQAAITETEDFIETDWSSDSWTVLQTVITNAWIVLNNINSAQLEVDAALAELNTAIAALDVDKAALQSAVIETEGLTEADWSAASWADLQTAILEAEALLDDTNSKQSEIDEAVTKLNTAIAGLDVDKIALQATLAKIEGLTETDWSVASWTVLQTVVLEAQAVLDDTNSKQSEIDAVVAQLNAAIADLGVDKTALQTLVRGTEGLIKSDWSVASWLVLQTAVLEAQAVLDATISKQSEIDAVVAQLNKAIDGLAVDKSALRSAVTSAESKVESDYSPDSWAQFAAALGDARTVIDNTNPTQLEIDVALTELNTAIAALDVDKTALQSAVNRAKDFIEADWSVDSWTVLQTAVLEAQRILDGTNSKQSDIGVAVTQLNKAIDGLAVDKSALRSAVTSAESKVESDYSPASWAQFTAALGNARTVIDNTNPTQLEIDAALIELNTGIAALDVDKVELQAKLNETEGLTKTDWSVDSWTVLQSAILEAEVILDDISSKQSEIDAAVVQLNAAIVGLTVDKSALLSASEEFKVESDYSPASWAQFAAALGDARMVIDDIDAKQSEIDAALAQLNAAIAGLYVDKVALQATLTETEGLTETDWSVDSWTVLQNAIANANAAHNNTRATQSEIDAALTKLNIALGELSVDKSALQAAVKLAENKVESDYSPVNWRLLVTILKDARAVIGNSNVIQSEIDVILAKINAAIAGLEVDKAALTAMIASTEELTETDWSVDSWIVLQISITEAQVVLSVSNSKQSEVDAALAALNTAIAALNVDKSALEIAIVTTSGLTETDYSKASWTNLQTVLDVARTISVLNDASQSDVDNATNALTSAIGALQPAQKIGIPTELVGVGGDKQVSLAWSAPADGGTVVGYLVDYSLDNGATWQGSPSAGTEVVVSGLMNNKAYIFRVAAVNESGTGAYSASSSVIIPTVPVLDEDEELPQPDIGEAVVIADGKRANVVIEVVDNSVLRLRGDEFEMNLTSIDINSENVPISEIKPVIRILRGEGSMIRLNGFGYEPGTYISIYLFSQPILLGQMQVQSDGTFEGALPLMVDLDVGLHTLQANGLVGPAKVEKSVSVGVLVVENTGQQISFNPLPEKIYGEAPFKLNAWATSNLPISYSVSGMDGMPTDIVELLDDNILKINKTGQVRVTAIQNGSDIFDAASSVTQVLLISPRQATSILDPEPLKVFYGTEFNTLEKPTTVQINFSDGTQRSIPVIWEKRFYNPNILGDQRLVGSFVLDEYSENRDNIKVELLIAIIENPVFIPNAFTPNGDGVNDVFIIRGLESYNQADLSVFNRWGNEVYRNTNYKNTWDGNNLNEGTYYYKLSMKKGDDVQVYTGWILIKR